MFVFHMSGIYIHKASNKYVILTTALMLYVSYLFCFLFLQQDIKDISKSEFSYFLEMDNRWNSSSLQAVKSDISNIIAETKNISYSLIEKETSWQDLSKTLNLPLSDNPLSNIIVIKLDHSLSLDQIDQIKANTAVITVYTRKPSGASFKTILISPYFLVPLLILSCLIFISVLQGATKSNLNDNRKVIESLLIAGAHHGRMSSVFRRNALFTFLFSLFLALILSLGSFYLLNGAGAFEYVDIKAINLFKLCLLPTLIIMIMHFMLVLWKVDRFIKSV